MAAAVAAFLTEATGVAITAAAVQTAITITAVVSSVLYSQARARAQADAARRAFNAGLVDQQVTLRSAVAPRTSTYGRDKVSGPIVFAHNSGSKKEFLHLVIPLSGRQWDAIEKIYFNETELPDPDGSGFITSGPFAATATQNTLESVTGTSITLANAPSRIVSVTGDGGPRGSRILSLGTDYTVSGSTVTFAVTGTYRVAYEYTQNTPRVRIKRYVGAPGQTADADLIAESSGKWTSDHVGVGIPYIYVRLEWDRNVFGQIGVPVISVRGRGNLVRDPRTGTTAWSENAALCTSDYMLDAELGMGCTSAQVPDADVIAAANIADENVALDGVGTTQKRYTFNGTLSSATGRRANLQTLLLPLAGAAVWVQGRWLLRAGAYRSPEFTLDESWLAGPGPEIVARTPRSELFNAVTGTYLEPAAAYAEVQFTEVTNSGYLAADGGRRIVRKITMPGVQDAKRAQRLAKIALERGRQSHTIRVECNMRAYDTLPTQVGEVRLARYGYAPLIVEVVERRFDVAQRKIRLVLRKTASTVWDWAYGEATPYDPGSGTILPRWDTAPAALAGLGASSTADKQLDMGSGTKLLRALVTWTQSTDAFVVRGGSIEIQHRIDTATLWQPDPSVPGDSTSAYVSPLEQQRATIIRIRPVTSNGRAGPWTYITHLAESDVAIGGSQIVPGTVDTPNLASDAVTVQVPGTLDTATYTAAPTGGALPGRKDYTPAFNCTIVARMRATLGCSNASGATKVNDVTVYAQWFDGAGGSGQATARRVTRNIANGETWNITIESTVTVTAVAFRAYTFSMHYSDRVAATIDSTLTDTLVELDVRKR